MPAYPFARIEHTRNGCIVRVYGHGYRATAEWGGDCDSRGRPRFTATLKADGYDEQRSVFSIGAGMYPDDPANIAEMTLALFSIGEHDVDEEFWKPDPRAHHDPRWIASDCSQRESLDIDREIFEARAAKRRI